MQLQRWAAWLDSRLRYFDVEWWRLEAGPLSRLGIRRQNFEAFLWPSLLAAALWTGMPTMHASQLLGLVVGLLFFGLLVIFNRLCASANADLFAQLAVLFGLIAVVSLLGVDEAGTDHLLYRHLLLPVVGIVGIGLCISVILARLVGRQLQLDTCNYPQGLGSTELFQVRGARLASSPWAVETFYVFLSVLMRPFELLWCVALAVLLARPAYVTLTAVVATCIMVAVIALTVVDDRLESSLQLLMRRLFRNTALGVSLVILGLGAARLSGVSYVTTIFDSASGIEIIIYLLAPYALAFWYDYWTDRLIGQQLFVLLNPAVGNACSIPYPFVIPALCEDGPPTSVPTDGRTIELHGQGRFLVFRSDPSFKNWRFQAWSYQELFVQVAAFSSPGGRAIPLPDQILQRIGFYRGATYLLTAILMCTGGLYLHRQTKKQELEASSKRSAGTSLSALLNASTFVSGRPAVLVAASGGGTRAAVFTGAVLEGLDEIRPNAIVAGSGVSGGAAALALYAGHRNELQDGSETAWNDYFDEITKPYIQDVIERAQEWRMVLHGRLGILLTESFDRYWRLPTESSTFGSLGSFGLITNATLAGRFDMDRIPLGKSRDMTLAAASSRYEALTRSDVAGGRLVMTNLDLHNAFKEQSWLSTSGADSPSLPIIVDDRETSVQRAAALSANFPPVFSNAAVEIDGMHRYWVTDGGAADNLGVESLLFALRDVVKNTTAGGRLPAVIIVLVDASGIDDTYTQDRGVGSALGAGSHFAGQLDAELEAELKDAYCQRNQCDDLAFKTIAMPKILRTSGSFGTHWMLQPSIRVDNSAKTGITGNRVFEGRQVVNALRAAYGQRSTAHTQPLDSWIRDADEYSNWVELKATVAARTRP